MQNVIRHRSCENVRVRTMQIEPWNFSSRARYQGSGWFNILKLTIGKSVGWTLSRRASSHIVLIVVMPCASRRSCKNQNLGLVALQPQTSGVTAVIHRAVNSRLSRIWRVRAASARFPECCVKADLLGG